MTFDIVRIVLLTLEHHIESDINDYKVVIYHEDRLYDVNISKTMYYRDIPNCFNCIVHDIDFDFDNKKIWIKSEVVNNE